MSRATMLRSTPGSSVATARATSAITNEMCTGHARAHPVRRTTRREGRRRLPAVVGRRARFCDQDEDVHAACRARPVRQTTRRGKVNVVCRAGSGDLCDPDERCTGISGQGCPADVVANPTTVCRAGSGDVCDPTEHCTAVPGAAVPGGRRSARRHRSAAASSGTCDVVGGVRRHRRRGLSGERRHRGRHAVREDGNLWHRHKCNASGARASSRMRSTARTATPARRTRAIRRPAA